MKPTQIDQVIAVLREGPCTTAEVSVETGLPIKHCSAHLSTLLKDGRAVVTGQISGGAERCAHCGYRRTGPPSRIYALVEQLADKARAA